MVVAAENQISVSDKFNEFFSLFFCKCRELSDVLHSAILPPSQMASLSCLVMQFITSSSLTLSPLISAAVLDSSVDHAFSAQQSLQVTKCKMTSTWTAVCTAGDSGVHGMRLWAAFLVLAFALFKKLLTLVCFLGHFDLPYNNRMKQQQSFDHWELSHVVLSAKLIDKSKTKAACWHMFFSPSRKSSFCRVAITFVL